MLGTIKPNQARVAVFVQKHQRIAATQKKKLNNMPIISALPFVIGNSDAKKIPLAFANI